MSGFGKIMSRQVATKVTVTLSGIPAGVLASLDPIKAKKEKEE